MKIVFSKILPKKIDGFINNFGILGNRKSLISTLQLIKPDFNTNFSINLSVNAISSGSRLANFRRKFNLKIKKIYGLYKFGSMKIILPPGFKSLFKLIIELSKL